MPSETLKLLKKHGPPATCYTCAHPVANDLILKLVKTLQAERAEGRMLVYSDKGLLDAVVDYCETRKPYKRGIAHFRNHLKESTNWYGESDAS